MSLCFVDNSAKSSSGSNEVEMQKMIDERKK